MRWAFAAFSVSQFIAGLAQQAERIEKYHAARREALARGKPLLVAGGPFGSNPLRHILHVPAHGCGDYCVDLDPAACLGCPNSLVTDIRDIPLPDAACGAALASHILEHLPTVADCHKAINELLRVADVLYVAGPTKLSLIAWLIPDHSLWCLQDREGNIRVEPRQLWSGIWEPTPVRWE